MILKAMKTTQYDKKLLFCQGYFLQAKIIDGKVSTLIDFEKSLKVLKLTNESTF